MFNKKFGSVLKFSWLFKLVLAASGVLIIVALVLPAFLRINDEPETTFASSIFFRNDRNEDSHSCFYTKYESRIAELKRILASVRRDLLTVAHQLEGANLELETTSKRITDAKNELKVLHMDIEDAELYQKELSNRNHVPIRLPLAPILQYQRNFFEYGAYQPTSLESVLDFSKCSIINGLLSYVYNVPSTASNHQIEYHKHFSELSITTKDPGSACLFIAVVQSEVDMNTLKYWNGGTNHVLLNVGEHLLSSYPNAIIVSSSFAAKTFKHGMDISLHLKVADYDKNEWEKLPHLLPLSRKYLLSYVGTPNALSYALQEQLHVVARSAADTGDQVYFIFNCTADDCTFVRESINKDSTFALLFNSVVDDSSAEFHEQLLSSLRRGAIPVIASLRAHLPLPDLIDWRKAVYQIAPQRLTELHFILKSFAPSDLLEMKRQGRFLLQNYFSNKKVVTETLVAALRERIGIPGECNPSVSVKPLFGSKATAANLVPAKPSQFEEEYLGPREAPYVSPGFTHNFTSLQMYSSFFWNSFGRVAGRTLEYFNMESPFPSDFEMVEGVEWGFRPMASGSGAAFAAALGGNRPREQFTVVLLSYQREDVLLSALERLNNMPYLNKILVIWNSREPPIEHAWPRLHVPVLFHNASKNSLNNRFLPYEEIETEAVLSLDDDIDLKQHEIIFAFRVWREQRSKIVGFPARHHAHFGNVTYYNSNHTCQHSMVLTGAAFIHKAYFYAYTYGMPEIIREKVDEVMNCEDLAMNFLVAHITRSPPIKTTSKWTFRCPNCKYSLYQRPSHYDQRSECLRFLTQVYGYNPLLYTQFRVDSVLFKTRLPINHQKCFKYV